MEIHKNIVTTFTKILVFICLSRDIMVLFVV